MDNSSEKRYSPRMATPSEKSSLEPPARILIVRLSAIGDVIHALPCLHVLRTAFPKARIGWLVEELSAPLLAGHPEIDDLFTIPKKRWRAHPLRPSIRAEKHEFYSRLRNGRWEVAIDFQGLTKSAWAAWRSGAPRRIGFAGEDGRELSKWFATERVLPDPARPHVIDRNMALLRPFGLDSQPVEWRFPDFSTERAHLAEFFDRIGIGPQGRYIALCPGAGWETKRWPVEHFARLSQRIAEAAARNPSVGLPIVLVWGPGEETLCREILSLAALDPGRLVLAPATRLRELAALLERAAVVVGGDTGPVHLAAALGVPVVGIYGGSDPVRNGPWGERHRVFLSDSVPCVGCWRTRCNRTPHLECMTTIRPETAFEAVAAIVHSD
ncbi:lipopolysaccharide heptosyltransferase I [Candidatus Sumerlaeota bacterium]|nr:lipopolysaccharide heptosyltransferase I [Candidatus Sumerlaeota bacterium]